MTEVPLCSHDLGFRGVSHTISGHGGCRMLRRVESRLVGAGDVAVQGCAADGRSTYGRVWGLGSRVPLVFTI